MRSIITCKWSIYRLYVEPSEGADDNPNKPKLLNAIEPLRAFKLLKKKKEINEFEAQSWAALLPMQL